MQNAEEHPTQTAARERVHAAQTEADRVTLAAHTWQAIRSDQAYFRGLGVVPRMEQFFAMAVHGAVLDQLSDLLGEDRVDAIGTELDQGERLRRRQAKAKARTERGN